MKSLRQGFLAFIVPTFGLLAYSQSPGALDGAFNPQLTPESTFGPPDAFRPRSKLGIYAIALQGDGKILIGGAFSAVNGVPRNRIARLNEDGTLDASFNPGTGATGTVITGAGTAYSADVEAILVQNDGKILIGGGFAAVNGVARNSLARLNADGSVDKTFDSASNFSRVVTAMILQPDGKILVGGQYFSSSA